MVVGIDADEGIRELMRCSTCGENLLHGEDRCPTCGSVVARRPVPASRDRGVMRCARCGHRGDGIPYFRKPLHAALLAGVSFMTFGLGGIVYYASHRRNLVCPDCGLGWEHSRKPGETAELAPPAPAVVSARPGSASVTGPLPPSGIGRRVFGIGLAVIGTLMIVGGVADGNLPNSSQWVRLSEWGARGCSSGVGVRCRRDAVRCSRGWAERSFCWQMDETAS